jgi:hypothetical protein
MSTQATAKETRGFRPAKGHLVNVNGTLINPDHIVTAHIESGMPPDPKTPHIKPPDALVLKTVAAGELRFYGKEAEEFWADLNQANE